MAAKKKTPKKQAKAKKKPSPKTAPTKKVAKKRALGKPKPATKRPAPKKAMPTAKTSTGKAGIRKLVGAGKTPNRKRGQRRFAASEPRRGEEWRSGQQAGDLQGLSHVEESDSESVDELLEEGNAFEAGIVKGVEDAENSNEREVHTHEVPEDDVPEEYLDQD